MNKHSNVDLARRAERILPGGHSSPSRNVGFPLAFVKAEGAWLFDADGQRYADYHCAFGANVLGHRNEAVAGEVAKVMQRIDLVGMGITDIEVEAAELLQQAIPCAEKIAFCNSGSEATYHALRLARAATGADGIIKFQGGFHGWHDSVAMNVQSTAEAIGSYDPISSGILSDAARHTVVLPYNDGAAVDAYVRDNPGKIAAIIVEPIAHNVGSLVAHDEFLRDLRRIATQNNIVLIFDEVITGFRHALGGYQSIVGVTPDLATFGKAAASGYPVGIVAGRADILGRVGRFGADSVFMGGTFNAVPSTMAAIKGTVGQLQQPGAYQALYALADRLRDGVCEILKRRSIPAQIAGHGSVWLIYFFEGRYDRYEDILANDNELDLRFRKALFDKKHVFQPLPLKRLYLSMSHTDEMIDNTLSCIDKIFANI